MNLDRLYDELESGKNLTDIFLELNKKMYEDGDILVPMSY